MVDNDVNFYIDDDGTPRSKIYNDLYFSKDDGYAESLYNFADGVDLKSIINTRDNHIKIAELGFGTGLNFLITADIFNKNHAEQQHLHYFSVEAFPLSITQIIQALKPCMQDINMSLADLVRTYPAQIPGIHHIYVTPHITLTLGFGLADQILPQIQGNFDGWYLDGFNPSQNKDMWTIEICEHIKRLSHNKTKLATFTAAGFVRRQLQDVGFAMSKTKGFGHKRERLIGVMHDGEKNKQQFIPKKIAIVGAGIAGCSAVSIAKRYGHHVTLFEKADEIGAGASGNILGLLNPKLEAQPSPKVSFYSAALTFAHHFYGDAQAEHDICYQQCGSIHLITDARKEKRFQKFQDNLGWGDNLSNLSILEVEEKVGFSVEKQKALFMPLSARLSPIKAIAFLAKKADDVYLNCEITSIVQDGQKERLFNDDKDLGAFDAIIIANGLSALKLCPSLNDQLSVIRGQITQIENKELAQMMRNNFSGNLCFGGYLSHLKDDQFVLGATYDRDVVQSDDLQDRKLEDDQRNLNYMKRMIGNVPGDTKVIDGRASLRVTTKDYMPLVEKVANNRALYLSLAHRSHGLLSAPLCAHKLITEIID